MYNLTAAQAFLTAENIIEQTKHCGIRGDFLEFVADRSPHKQGRYLPGTHIPIVHPDRVREARPDFLLILPWNIKDEVMQQNAFVREWGGRFVVPIPQVAVL